MAIGLVPVQGNKVSVSPKKDAFPLMYVKMYHLCCFIIINQECIFGKKTEHDNLNSLCRIIPSAVPDQTIRNIRHERYCHMLKGVVAKCDGCNQIFTSQKLIWNAVDVSEI